MSADLNAEELAQVFRACEPIRIKGCTPDYLQGLLVHCLLPTNPALATRVAQFDGPRMDALCQAILEHQEGPG